MPKRSNSCKVCESERIGVDGFVDGRVRYKCRDCKILFFADEGELVIPGQRDGRRMASRKIRGRLPGEMAGVHYRKTFSKISAVVEMYNQGLGYLLISRRSHLAKNTVKKIVIESTSLINADTARRKRMRRQIERHQTVVFAIKGLVITCRRNNLSLESILDRTNVLISKYMAINPDQTTMALTGSADVSNNDVTLRAYEEVMKQWLKLNTQAVRK